MATKGDAPFKFAFHIVSEAGGKLCPSECCSYLELAKDYAPITFIDGAYLGITVSVSNDSTGQTASISLYQVPL